MHEKGFLFVFENILQKSLWVILILFENSEPLNFYEMKYFLIAGLCFYSFWIIAQTCDQPPELNTITVTTVSGVILLNEPCFKWHLELVVDRGEDDEAVVWSSRCDSALFFC